MAFINLTTPGGSAANPANPSQLAPNAPGFNAGATRPLNAFDVGGRSFVSPFAIDPAASTQRRSTLLAQSQEAAEAGLRSQAGTDIQGAEEFGQRSEAFARARLGKIGGFEGTFGIALQNSIAARTEKTIGGIKAATERAVQSGRMELASRLADLEFDQMQTMVSLNKFAFDQFNQERQREFQERGIGIDEADLDIRQQAEARAQKESEQDVLEDSFVNNSTGEVTQQYRRPDGTRYTKSLGAIGQRTIFKGGDTKKTAQDRFTDAAQEIASLKASGQFQGAQADATYRAIVDELLITGDYADEDRGLVESILNRNIERLEGTVPTAPVDELVGELENQVLPQRTVTPAQQTGASARQAINPLVQGAGGALSRGLQAFAEPFASAGRFTGGFLRGR